MSAGAAQWLVLGDSISAAYGMEREQGWVDLLQRRVAAANPTIRIANASISGETTSGGLARLPALLEKVKPRLVIIELGANDGLRGTPLPVIGKNLASLVTLSRQSGAEVVLLGMRLPPNYGMRYAEGFFNQFQQVGARYRVPLVPFFLDGVGGVPALMQADGLHPNADAQPTLLDNIWPQLQSYLVREG